MFNTYLCYGDCETYLDYLFNSLEAGLMVNEVILSNSEGKAIDFRIIEVNHSFEKVFHIKKETLEGKTITEVLPEIEFQWIEDCGQVALCGSRIQKDLYIQPLDKHFRVSIVSPVQGQIVVLFDDITEMIKADEVLKKHYILFDNAKDIILYLKGDGSIIDANKKAVEEYGYSRTELLEMNLKQLRHPSTMVDYNDQMKRSATAKGTVFECLHVKKGGTAFPVEVSSSTIEINGERTRIHIIRNITERKQAEEKISHLAKYDALTQIFNRGSLMEQLQTLLSQSEGRKSSLAVMLIDVDKFKQINDIHGHNAGDAVLKAVAQRLQAAVRKLDIVGRLGGDEFFLILPQLSGREELAFLAQRILDQVARPISWNEIDLDIRISIGIAVYPNHAKSMEALIHNADYAMYGIKHRGGGGYSFYSE